MIVIFTNGRVIMNFFVTRFHCHSTGYLGCNKDVWAIVDELCDGRNECVLPVPDPSFEKGEPACNPDFRSYLEVTYACSERISGSAKYI